MDQALRWNPTDKDGWSTENRNGWLVGVVRGKLIKLRQTEDGQRVEFRTNDPEDSVGEMLRDYLRLDQDISPMHRALRKDKRLAPLVDAYGGMRILRQEPWECLITYVCSPRHYIPRLREGMENLAKHFGEPLSLGNTTGYSFPGPQSLADASVDELRALGLGMPRHAEYVQQLAGEVSGGKLDLCEVGEMPYDAAEMRLKDCKGIGPKVANCVLLFSMGKQEAFPLDTYVRQGLFERYGKEYSDPRLLGWAQGHFGRNAGYASQLLFHWARSGMPALR